MHAIWTPPRWLLLAAMTLTFMLLVLAMAPTVDLPSVDLSFGRDAAAPDPAPAAPTSVELGEGFSFDRPLPVAPLEMLGR